MKVHRTWKESDLVTGTIESVTIESDERGFELHLTDTDGTQYVLNVHAVAARLLKATQDEIGSWLEEGRRLAAEHERELESEAGDGYELSDPKHPTYHERMTS